MFSIYSSIYRLSGGFIDYISALDNFCTFADEVVVSTTTDSKDNTIKLLQNYALKNPKVKLVITDLKLDSAYFDGELKDAALKQCTQQYCILLDADERLQINDKMKWVRFAEYLSLNEEYDALFIPVIDLFNNDRCYKSIGFKWYLSKNKSNIGRGIVNFAKKDDGTIFVDKSDSTELIYRDSGNLVKSQYLISPNLSDGDKLQYIKQLPLVYHLGWLNKDSRLLSNAFWQGIWNKRAGHEVTNIIHDKEKLDKIEYWPHGLKLWYE